MQLISYLFDTASFIAVYFYTLTVIKVTMVIKRGQISVEFVLIFSFAMLLLVPTIYLFYNQSLDSVVEIETQQLVSIGNQILSDAQQIYVYGSGSAKTLTFRLPKSVENISIVGGHSTELVITSNIQGSFHNLVFFGQYNMSIGNCSTQSSFSENFLRNPGQKSIRIESCGTFVAIRESDME